jgi:predicted TIM-barrel fold metal-dependent hydrolase
LAAYARKFPDLPIIIDHCGVPFDAPRGAATIDDTVAMAEFPNVGLKWAHATSFLSTEPYPFPDLAPKLRRAMDAFGRERVMWASDYTVTRHRANWGESLFYLLDSPVLSNDDKAWLLGRTARTTLKWPGPEVPPKRRAMHPHRVGGAAPPD